MYVSEPGPQLVVEPPAQGQFPSVYMETRQEVDIPGWTTESANVLQSNTNSQAPAKDSILTPMFPPLPDPVWLVRTQVPCRCL